MRGARFGLVEVVWPYRRHWISLTMGIMGAANAVVSALLRSPLHGLLSGSICVVRYTGQRSHGQFTTPTQYARHDDEVIVLVGRAETKTWWKNFRDQREIDLLLRRRWLAMTARAVVGAEEPETMARLLELYLERFPKAARALGGDTEESRARSAVVVSCRPR